MPVLQTQATGGPRRNPRRSTVPQPASADTELLSSLAAGDEQALLALMDRYGGQLMHFAYRMTGDMGLAEEIFQDTMLKAWRQAQAFRLDGHLKAWLFRVARNAAIDSMRRKRVYTEEYSACMETAAASLRPEEAAERAWLTEEVMKAMGQLPLAYQEVLELRFFQGLCYQEIADVMTIPLGTVKSRLNYAVQRLTKILGANGVDPSTIEP